MTQTIISTDIDFNRTGKQAGFFRLPYSGHDDAWGMIPVPMAVIANGTGPTVLLQGGNHGDEYEGPIALGEIIRNLDPGRVSGRLIIVPAINLPAVNAASRVSPIDGLNFNRTFPGDHLGSPTLQLSAYVNDVLFQISDAFVDLHSGGSSLSIVPSAAIEPSDDPALAARIHDAVAAFDAPMNVVISNRGDPRTSTASAVRAGLVTVGTEMGGCGTVSLEGLAICRRGVRNLLHHFGVVENEVPPTSAPKPLFELGARAHILAEEDGVFEPCHPLGAALREGEVAGRIHSLRDPRKSPVDLPSRCDGVLYGLRHPGKVRSGNCCAVVASPCR